MGTNAMKGIRRRIASYDKFGGGTGSLSDLSLIAAIKRMGWEVPQRCYSAGGRQGNYQACSACFEELRNKVGPHTERAVRVKILENGSYP
jgi:hypothetical protein